MVKIYVASSWRNDSQQTVVELLRGLGHQVYDFKHPKDGDDGFHWSEIDGGWQSWDAERYRQALKHEVAERGFRNDFDAMKWADACVLVLPCGRSAHLEAGWFTGAGKPVGVYLNGTIEPELMYKLIEPAGAIFTDPTELFDWVEKLNHDWDPDGWCMKCGAHASDFAFPEEDGYRFGVCSGKSGDRPQLEGMRGR